MSLMDLKEIKIETSGDLIVSSSQSSINTCCICTDEIYNENDNNITFISLACCSKLIHKHCLSDFIRHNLSSSIEIKCPLCRSTILRDDYLLIFIEIENQINQERESQTNENENTHNNYIIINSMSNRSMYGCICCYGIVIVFLFIFIINAMIYGALPHEFLNTNNHNHYDTDHIYR